MAKLSKSEFATKCGMKSNGLAVYIKRGKVIANGDEIDDTIPQNQIFFAKHFTSVKGEITPLKKSRVEKPDKLDERVEQALSLDNEKKKIEIERADLSRQLMQAKLGQQSGRVIPVDAVKLGLDQHFRDMTLFVGQGLKNLTDEICRKAKLNINQKVEINTTMERILNDSVNRAIDATTITLRNLQKEYSLKRGAGDR
jgi:hypothetical protein